MRVDRMQERTAGRAIDQLRLGTGAPRYQRVASDRSVGGSIPAAVTIDGIVGRIPNVRIEDSELGVIENVEAFEPEFDVTALGHLEVLQQRHIKIDAVRIIQVVAAGVSESKPLRSREGRRIVE